MSLAKAIVHIPAAILAHAAVVNEPDNVDPSKGGVLSEGAKEQEKTVWEHQRDFYAALCGTFDSPDWKEPGFDLAGLVGPALGNLAPLLSQNPILSNILKAVQVFLAPPAPSKPLS